MSSNLREKYLQEIRTSLADIIFNIDRESKKISITTEKTACKLLFRPMINYGHVRFLFSKLFIPVTGRFLKRSPIRTADCSSCQVRALAEAIARDSPASKFASLVHTLPRDASPATSTLGTLVIFVKEAPSASLRPEREREQQNTHVFT